MDFSTNPSCSRSISPTIYSIDLLDLKHLIKSYLNNQVHIPQSQLEEYLRCINEKKYKARDRALATKLKAQLEITLNKCESAFYDLSQGTFENDSEILYQSKKSINIKLKTINNIIMEYLNNKVNIPQDQLEEYLNFISKTSFYKQYRYLAIKLKAQLKIILGRYKYVFRSSDIDHEPPKLSPLYCDELEVIPPTNLNNPIVVNQLNLSPNTNVDLPLSLLTNNNFITVNDVESDLKMDDVIPANIEEETLDLDDNSLESRAIGSESKKLFTESNNKINDNMSSDLFPADKTDLHNNTKNSNNNNLSEFEQKLNELKTLEDTNNLLKETVKANKEMMSNLFERLKQLAEEVYNRKAVAAASGTVIEDNDEKNATIIEEVASYFREVVKQDPFFDVIDFDELLYRDPRL